MSNTPSRRVPLSVVPGNGNVPLQVAAGASPIKGGVTGRRADGSRDIFVDGRSPTKGLAGEKGNKRSLNGDGGAASGDENQAVAAKRSRKSAEGEEVFEVDKTIGRLTSRSSVERDLAATSRSTQDSPKLPPSVAPIIEMAETISTPRINVVSPSSPDSTASNSHTQSFPQASENEDKEVPESQDTIITIPDESPNPRTTTTHSLGRPAVSDEVREVAHALMIKLRYAQYKVNTQQTSVPLSRLELRVDPTKPQHRFTITTRFGQQLLPKMPPAVSLHARRELSRTPLPTAPVTSQGTSSFSSDGDFDDEAPRTSTSVTAAHVPQHYHSHPSTSGSYTHENVGTRLRPYQYQYGHLYASQARTGAGIAPSRGTSTSIGETSIVPPATMSAPRRVTSEVGQGQGQGYRTVEMIHGGGEDNPNINKEKGGVDSAIDPDLERNINPGGDAGGAATPTSLVRERAVESLLMMRDGDGKVS